MGPRFADDRDRPMDPETSLPFFFYGTLMEGCGNDRMLPAETEFHRAYVVGYQLHYARPRFTGYPIARRVGTDFDQCTLQGEVAWLDVTHPKVLAMTDMEIGAGYVVRPVTAQIYVPGDDFGKTTGALIFEYPEGRHNFGSFIPSGNWRNQ